MPCLYLEQVLEHFCGCFRTELVLLHYLQHAQEIGITIGSHELRCLSFCRRIASFHHGIHEIVDVVLSEARLPCAYFLNHFSNAVILFEIFRQMDRLL
jgi:hypothetical protein